MRTGRHLSKKETCPRLLRGRWWGTQDTVIGSNLSSSPKKLNKTVQLHEHTKIQQRKNITTRRQRQAWNDKRNKTVRFPARLELSSRQHPHFWHRNVIVVINSIRHSQLRERFHTTERGMFTNEASVSLWLSASSGDRMWSSCARREYSVVGDDH